MTSALVYRNPQDNPPTDALAQGLFGVNYPAQMRIPAEYQGPEATDLVVLTGGLNRYNGLNRQIRNDYLIHGIPVVICEFSPIHREMAQLWVSSPGWLPPSACCPSDRRLAQDLLVRRQPRGEVILVAGQGHQLEKDEELVDYVRYASATTSRAFRYRRHPNVRSPWAMPCCDQVTNGQNIPLHWDLEDAWAVITHSSGVALEAMLRGIPVICHSSAPFAQVACPFNREVCLDQLQPYYTDLIYRYLDRFAYTHWTWEELRDGTAARWLRPYWELR